VQTFICTIGIIFLLVPTLLTTLYSNKCPNYYTESLRTNAMKTFYTSPSGSTVGV